MSLSRHAIRIKTLQALFALDMNKNLTVDKAVEFAMTYNNPEVEVINPEIALFVTAVQEQQLELDAMIEPHLKNWTLQRLARIDLLIMRMALVEMLGEDVPNAVAINEAIQLAKEFTTDKSRRFINAVLANIMQVEFN